MAIRESLSLNAWQLTLQVHRELSQLLDEELLLRAGIDLRAYEVLFYLSNAPEGWLWLNDLAESLLLKPPAATRFFDRLERAALVRRKHAKHDRRMVIVTLTGRGRYAFERAQPVYNELVRSHFGEHLTSDEAGILNASLDRILEALRQRRVLAYTQAK